MNAIPAPALLSQSELRIVLLAYRKETGMEFRRQSSKSESLTTSFGMVKPYCADWLFAANCGGSGVGGFVRIWPVGAITELRFSGIVWSKWMRMLFSPHPKTWLRDACVAQTRAGKTPC